MEPNQIFALIVKADERLKYANDARTGQRVDQARALLTEALTEATAISDPQLIAQAQRRLDELDA